MLRYVRRYLFRRHDGDPHAALNERFAHIPPPHQHVDHDVSGREERTIRNFLGTENRDPISIDVFRVEGVEAQDRRCNNRRLGVRRHGLRRTNT